MPRSQSLPGVSREVTSVFGQKRCSACAVPRSLVVTHPSRDGELSLQLGPGFCLEDVMVNSKPNPGLVKMLGIWYASTAVNQRGLYQ